MALYLRETRETRETDKSSLDLSIKSNLHLLWFCLTMLKAIGVTDLTLLSKPIEGFGGKRALGFFTQK